MNKVRSGLNFKEGMRDVIVISQHHYGVLGIFRMLVEAGVAEFEVIIVGSEGRMARWSKYVKNIFYFDENKTVSFLKARREGKNIEIKDIIVAGGDMAVEILSTHCETLKNHYILPIPNKEKYLTSFTDKVQQKKIAKQVGLSVVDGSVLNKKDVNLVMKAKTVKYPCITKSTSTTKGGKSDIFICTEAKDLLNSLKLAKAESLIIEPLIDKKNELCTFGIAINDDVYIPGTAIYLNTPPDGDYGGCFDILDDKFLSRYVDIEKMEQLVKEVGFQGVFCMEFLLDQNDKVYFMENNWRVSGFDYGMSVAGANLVQMWVEQKIARPPINKTRCMVTYFDFKQRVLSKNITLWTWLKQLRTCDVFFTWNRKDPLPLLGYIIDGFGRRLKRLLKRV